MAIWWRWGFSEMNGWSNFLTAMVGVSATLTGLIFIGVSINLEKIITLASLPVRALEALFLLLSVLVICALLLVPGQSQAVVGAEVAGMGLAFWFLVGLTSVKIVRTVGAEYKRVSLAMVGLSQAAMAPYVIAGVTIFRVGFVGLYWLVPGVVLSILKANLDAWVLLVEINR